MHSQFDYEGRKASHKLIFIWQIAMNPSAFETQFFEQSLLKCNVIWNGDAHQSTSSGEMVSDTGEAKCKGKSKGQWTPAEDSLLLHMVEKYGQQQWARIATNLPGRRGKQCRERWQNHLRPDIKREEWSLEEECLLVKLHKQFGNKWAQIARRLPGRPENAIKNHWNATLRSKNRRKPRKVGESPSVLHDYIQRIHPLHHPTTLSPPTTSQDGDELQRMFINIYDDYVCQTEIASPTEDGSRDLLQDVICLALLISKQ
ncbi:hypothetical protein SUGI_0955340 [Cryptomeria japonica]|nr:hypothetical protein SUGI_0955340 [Cryptomeria japonica]